MKSIKEIKEEIANSAGWDSWQELLSDSDFKTLDETISSTMSRYADEKTAEFQSAYDELEEENKHLRKAVKFKDEPNNPLKEENEFIRRKAGEKFRELKEENQSMRDQLDSLKLRVEDAEANENVSDQKNLDLALIVKRLKAKNKKRKKRIKSLKTELKEANFHKDVYRKMLYHLKGLGL